MTPLLADKDLYRTRVVAVAPRVEAARFAPLDRCTRVMPARGSWATFLADARTTFEQHRVELTTLIDAQQVDGYLAVAVSSVGVVGRVWNKAGPRPRVATIGRHSCCDVSTPGDDRASLRHLVLLVRTAPDGTPRARLFDLSSLNDGDGQGGTLKSFEVGDMAAIAIPGHWVFFFRTGEGNRGLRARTPFIDTSVPIVPLQGTEGAGRLVFKDSCEGLSGTRLAEGVLLGRYERCLNAQFDASGSVSRVHAVLVEDHGDTLVLDAGSTNGVVVNGDLCRARLLVSGDEVSLGQVTFEWRPAPVALAVTARPLIPEGTEEWLAKSASGGPALQVFADWLLDHGSRWGEWIAAALRKDHARATLLQEELEFLLLGPIAGLDERTWENGVLVSAKLVHEQRLNWSKALRWPLWAGVRDLSTDEGSANDWAQLRDAGVLRALRATTVWTMADVLRLGEHALTELRVHGEPAVGALSQVLPSLKHLERVHLEGSVPLQLCDALGNPGLFPALSSVRIEGAGSLSALAGRLTPDGPLKRIEVKQPEQSVLITLDDAGVTATGLVAWRRQIKQLRADLQFLPRVTVKVDASLRPSSGRPSSAS